MDNELRLTECERRLANMLMLGSIIAVDAEQHKVQVDLGFDTPWLSWLTQRAGHDKTYWAPSVGEQVLVLSPQGDPALGVVLPALYQDQFPAPTSDPEQCQVHFSDGAAASYNKASHQLAITLPSDGQVHLTAHGGINITGDLTVSGNITASQTISDGVRSMAEDRALFNQHTHVSPETGARTSGPEGSQ